MKTTATISQHLTTKKDKKKLCKYFLTCKSFRKSLVFRICGQIPLNPKSSYKEVLCRTIFRGNLQNSQKNTRAGASILIKLHGYAQVIFCEISQNNFVYSPPSGDLCKLLNQFIFEKFTLREVL